MRIDYIKEIFDRDLDKLLSGYYVEDDALEIEKGLSLILLGDDANRTLAIGQAFKIGAIVANLYEIGQSEESSELERLFTLALQHADKRYNSDDYDH